MKIDPSKSFRVEPVVNSSPQKPEIKSIDNEKLINELKQQLSTEKMQREAIEQKCHEIEIKHQKAVEYVQNITNVLSEKTKQLEKFQNSVSSPVQVVIPKIQSDSEANLKSELMLAHETISQLEFLKKLNDVYSRILSTICIQIGCVNITDKLLVDHSMSNQDKIKTVSKVILDNFAVQSNELKIALSKFQAESIVLFVKDSRGNWEIFNRGESGYYLSTEAMEELKKKPGYKDLLTVVAQILFIETEVIARKDNPYGFIIGSKYNVVHIYPFQ